MDISEALQTHRSDLIEAMVRVLQGAGSADDGELRQFVVAFHGLMVAASAGDNGPRDEYLASVVPPLRQTGLPLADMVTGLLGMSEVVAAVLGQAHVPWLSGFFADYARELLKVWEQA
jgi:hypothetical protein